MKQKLLIIANAKTDNLTENYIHAVEEISEIIELIKHGEEAEVEPAKMTSEYRKLFDKEAFCNMVKKAKNYIYEGDICIIEPAGSGFLRKPAEYLPGTSYDQPIAVYVLLQRR